MQYPVNGARGEVGVTIGGVDIVIAATMSGLSHVSTDLGCKSMQDLFDRLSNVEVAAAMSAVKHLTVVGDTSAAVAALKISHFPALSKAFDAALSYHFKDDSPGNGEAGATA